MRCDLAPPYRSGVRHPAGRAILVGLLLWAAACGDTEPQWGEPDASSSADASVAPPDAAPPDAAPVIECDDLDAVIGLSEQIAANAGATRGRYPLVLAHGFFGFDEVGPLGYFNGADDALREAGFAAYVTAVEPIASSVDTRGPQLGREIACIAMLSGVAKINLVGHSQGGLDSRVVAADPLYSRWVASVTTVSTPHRGTLIADAALGLLPEGEVSDALLDAIAEFWGYLVGAPESDAAVRASLQQLSATYSSDFNLAVPDNPAIGYFSWAGRTVRNALVFDYGSEECDEGAYENPDARDVVDTELSLTHAFLNTFSGRNDGLVTLASARWGTFLGCMPADHADEIGLLSWPETNPFSGFNHKQFFVQVADELENRGY